MNVIEVNAGVIDTNVFLFREVKSFQQPAQDKGVELRVLQSPDLSVYADADMIKTVLRNLISNAIKFCKPGDVISVSVAAGENEALFTVEDNGIGIKAEDVDKLFNAHGFTTAGTANEKGTGLGLMLCKEFVTKNGGRIWVESELMKATRFYFTLPLAKEVTTVDTLLP